MTSRLCEPTVPGLDLDSSAGRLADAGYAVLLPSSPDSVRSGSPRLPRGWQSSYMPPLWPVTVIAGAHGWWPAAGIF